MGTPAIPSSNLQSNPTGLRRSLTNGVRVLDATPPEYRERRVGEMHHASVLKTLVLQLAGQERSWNIRVLPRQSVQVKPERHRVVDLAVMRRGSVCEPILTTPPLLVVEILCDRDRMAGSQALIADYVEMGVQAVWVIDPKRRRAYSAEHGGRLTEQRDDLTVSGTMIRVPVLELFTELDEMEMVIE